jgi:hypothetical protein
MVQNNPKWLIQKYPGDLKGQIAALIKQGYIISHRDGDTVQLTRKRWFNFPLAILLLIFTAGIGFVLYILFYISKRDDVVYLDLSTQTNPSA